MDEDVKLRKRKVDDGTSSVDDEIPRGPVVKDDQRIGLPLEKQVDLVVNFSKQDHQCDRCSKVFSTITEASNHYASKHMHRCNTCRKELPTPYLLELHVLEVHDSFFALQAEKKAMYSCLDEECSSKFSTPDERYSHCRGNHRQHLLHRAFQHFENIHKPKTGNARKGKPKDEGKMDEGIGQVQSTNIYPSELGDPARGMEVDPGPREDGDRTRKCSGDGAKKGLSGHISFGRHTQKFVPKSWHTVVTTSKMAKEDASAAHSDLDMSSMHDVLPVVEVNTAVTDTTN